MKKVKKSKVELYTILKYLYDFEYKHFLENIEDDELCESICFYLENNDYKKVVEITEKYDDFLNKHIFINVLKIMIQENIFEKDLL